MASTSEGVPKDRACPHVPYPSIRTPTEEEVFPDGYRPNYEMLFAHFHEEGRLHPDHAIRICRQAAALFRKEPNMLTLVAPITVCGDVHGQYYDLKKLFDLGGKPAATNYLFLGDYVDRGCFSCEVILYLLALKINFPDTLFMLRGNHECRQMTEFFNFREECEYKYSTLVWEAVMDVFDTLPLAALIDHKFLCVHGGLSPEIQLLEDINKIERVCEPPNSGPMCDLLWADPVEDAQEYLEREWGPNTVRGCSFVYGFKAVEPFLQRNRLYSIIRAHEAQLEGYRFYEYCQNTDFPSVVTIFSAPNYCDAYNNKGAILKFHDRIFNICQFKCAPHPYYLNNFMDVFTWSVPFVAEKVTEILYDMLGDPADDSDDEPSSSSSVPAAVAAAAASEPVAELDALARRRRTETNIAKMKSVTHFMKYYQTLRQESEMVLKLKGLVGPRLPFGLLSTGAAGLEQALHDYEKARQFDRVNEKMPDSGSVSPARSPPRSSPRSKRMGVGTAPPGK